VSTIRGFDLDDPDWPTLHQQIEAVGKLLETVRARVLSGRKVERIPACDMVAV
jgi:hypothetical protein